MYQSDFEKQTKAYNQQLLSELIALDIEAEIKINDPDDGEFIYIPEMDWNVVYTAQGGNAVIEIDTPHVCDNFAIAIRERDFFDNGKFPNEVIKRNAKIIQEEMFPDSYSTAEW